MAFPNISLLTPAAKAGALRPSVSVRSFVRLSPETRAAAGVTATVRGSSE